MEQEQEIKAAILKALGKFAELSFSQELSDSNHYLKVDFGPRNICLWLFDEEVKCVLDCRLTHLSESGVSTEDYGIETDELITTIEASFHTPAKVVSNG